MTGQSGCLWTKLHVGSVRHLICLQRLLISKVGGGLRCAGLNGLRTSAWNHCRWLSGWMAGVGGQNGCLWTKLHMGSVRRLICLMGSRVRCWYRQGGLDGAAVLRCTMQSGVVARWSWL